MSVVVALLVALAVAGAAGPAPRRAPGREGRGATRGRARPLPARGLRARALRGRGDGPRGARSSARDGDLAGLLHAVASQLRAGAPPGAAWAQALGTAVDGPVPEEAVLTAWAGARGQRARVRAVVAGSRVAFETGAPLAEVLEDLADAVAADTELEDDLEAALAGPRATARVLSLLPVLGLVVGTAMGAQPWRVLLDGGIGSVLAVAGLGLVVAGRAWVAALVRRAVAP